MANGNGNGKNGSNGKKKTGGIGSKLVSQQIAQRRSEVARLRMSGYDIAVIASELGVHPNTVSNDLKELVEQWYWRTKVDMDQLMLREIMQLETVREQAWRSFYETRNRHGEGRQNGYLMTVLRATEQLHNLLRLGDPDSNPGGGSPDDEAMILEVTVRTREQVKLIESKSIDYEDLAALHGEGGGEDDGVDEGDDE